MVIIDASLVRKLIAAQFPQWKDLPIDPVALSGWDNRTFHLGDSLLVRLPSHEIYEPQVKKEHLWLPRLSPHLPLKIPEPVALGQPGEGYPWKWSIRRWIEGEPVSETSLSNLVTSAKDLAGFLKALHAIDTKEGPLPGFHSFYRGGDLSHYDAETRKALQTLQGKIDIQLATQIWEEALSTSWKKPKVWVHGDLSAGNLLCNQGHLTAVLDFGQMAVGDPACDLAIAWTYFHGDSRSEFQKALPLDKDTWARGRGWTLWKTLITAAGLTNPNNYESKRCWQILEDLLSRED